MELTAGSTGPGFPHHPKIILFIAVHHMNCWIESGFFKNGAPKIMGFLVKISRFTFAGFVNGRVQAFGREFPYLGQ